jgi:tetratricopeptide (TPR) repeat protein
LGAKPSEVPDSEGRIPLIDAALGAAQALLAQARNPEAVERTRALLAKFPEHFEVNLWHGHALSAVESWDEAEAAYRKAIELTPSDFAGYVGLTQLLFKLDRPEEAARVLSEATGKVKDSADVRRMLGQSELMRHHLPEALRQFQAALRFDPNDAAALFGLGVTQRRSGDLDAAEKTLERLAAIEPTFPGLSTERGQLLEGRGDYEAAAEVYRKALEDQPHDTDLKLRLGAALVTADRVDEAEALLREVLKERPTSAEAEHFIGRVLFARGEAAQAAQRFERAVNFDAQRGDYHMYLAWAALEQENLSRALESVNKAVALDPSLGDAHWILGRVQLRTGAVKDAVESFQRALKLKPGRVEALAGMGDAYDQLRDLRRAVKAYQEAVKQRPDNGQWWYRLGMLHLDRGSRDEARVALAEAVLRGDRLTEKPHWLPEAHRNYADLLRDSEKQREALEHYRMFLELAPAAHPARTEVERLVRALSR